MNTEQASSEQPLKVLHIGKYFPPYRGGMETYLRDLMIALKPLGVDCSALVHRSDISLTSTEEQYEDEGEAVPVTRAAVWFRAVFTPFSPSFPLLLRKLIKRDKPDILHLHMPNVSAFWALFLPSARRIPWMVHWHSDVLPSSHSLGLRLFYRLYKPFETAVLKRAAKVIATSPPYLESSEPLRPYRDKCEVVPLGIRPPKQAPALEIEARNTTAPLKVLSVGRLSYYKGFRYLIEALSDVPDATLRIVGEGDERESLETTIAALGLEDRVTLVGSVDDEGLEREYQFCDVFCLPSIERTEAFGLVLLEAMAQNTACVASRIPGAGAAWIVRDGETGVITEQEDPASLSNALNHLSSARDKLADMGASGRARFDQFFDANQSARGLLTTYTRVLKAYLKEGSRSPGGSQH